MTKRSRYLLILLGAIIFTILAPFIVFYSSGLTIDWQNKRLVKTGIVAFKIDPKNSKVFLDGTEKIGVHENIKFLLPKDYELRFEQSGFCSWQKKLTIKAGEVTWASPFGNKIFLLKENSTPTNVFENADDFFYKNDTLYSLQNDQLFVQNLSDKIQYAIKLPLGATSLEFIDQNKFMAKTSSSETNNGSVFIDTESKKTFNLSSLFETTPKIKISGQQVFALENSTLYKTTPDFSSKTEYVKNAFEFSILEDTLYYLSTTSTSTALTAMSVSTGESTLVSTLPKLTSAEILITAQKQIFVQGDNQLYWIGFELKHLGLATEKQFEPFLPKLIYAGEGEISYFDFNKKEPKLISRSRETIGHPILASNIGYAIWQKDQNIEALELDTRDHQNSCLIYKAQALQKFQTDEQNRRLFVLDGSNVKVIEFR